MMASDLILQEKSKLLLQKLKNKQQKLQNIVKHPVSTNNELDQEFTETDPKLLYSAEASHVRNHQLIEEARKKLSGKFKLLPSKDMENNSDHLHRISYPSKVRNDILSTETSEKTCPKSYVDHVTEKVQTVDGTTPKTFLIDSPECSVPQSPAFSSRSKVGVEGKQHDMSAETPRTMHRKIIAKNIHVDGNLDNTECDSPDKLNSKKLNFSYSRYNESDYGFVQDKLEESPNMFRPIKSDNIGTASMNQDQQVDSNPMYKHHLQDPGNSRKIANFINDTTTKPKTDLFSKPSGDKSMTRVSFRTATDSSVLSLPKECKQKQKLLGYDWIAGLLDNSSGVMDLSEAHFEELRDFRRVNRDECVNHFYMEAPASLEDLKEREPEQVAVALEPTKVKPFTLNDRLFTVPIKKTVQGDVIDMSDRTHVSEPTIEDPRFVRVSIPRSTLMSPHRVKPHRRRSFDPTDTCSLNEHCLLGWQNACPSMMPSASNVDLKHATHGVKSHISTTLADAEKIASFYPYPWPANVENNPRSDPGSRMSKLHRTTLDSTLAAGMTSLPVTTDSQSIKRATDDLLNSTYSLMYELEKLKTERQLRSVQ